MELKISLRLSQAAAPAWCATARMLAQSGAKVTLLDRNRAAMESVAKEIGALALECDVTNEASVKAALATAGQAHGVARILINCAGILGSGPHSWPRRADRRWISLLRF